MNVAEIVKKYLDDNGFDGLAGDDCGCSKDDLFPCDCHFGDCEPAYVCDCEHDCGEYSVCFSSMKINHCIRELE